MAVRLSNYITEKFLTLPQYSSASWALQREQRNDKKISEITHNRTVCTIDIARQGNCLMTHVFSGHTPHVIQEKYLCQCFYFRRFRSQPFSGFFRAMREISKTPAREWGEKRRRALRCWEKWTLPCPCSFKIKLLKELATTNTPPSSRKKKNKQCWSPTASFLIPTKQLWPGWGEGRGHSGTKSTG